MSSLRKRLVLNKISIIAILLICSLFFSACADSSSNSQVYGETVKVVVEDNSLYLAKQSVYSVRRGGDISLRLTFEPGYAFDSCNYRGYTVFEDGDDTVVTLRRVSYPLRLTVTTKITQTSVRYHLNGGSFSRMYADNSSGDVGLMGDSYLTKVNTTKHLRVNTSLGREIERDGYTLIGWNTKSDYSGEHIGLGSRVTVNNSEICELYAEWARWNDADSFTYEINDNNTLTLTGCKLSGTIDKLVVPCRIDNKLVTIISEGFLYKSNINTLILPSNLSVVEKKAFSLCKITEIFFFDNITSISDRSFGGSIKTVHVNAAQSPRYVKDNDNSRFADDMDRLIMTSSQKQMVFFAGCSMSYGLNSPMMQEEFPDYVVCNMGVIGGTNAKFQLECITAYLGEGDIFVHAPESMSEYQLMISTSAEYRMFIEVESNYDLLSLCNFADTPYFFDCFNIYNNNRVSEELDFQSYDDYNAHYNEYGDIIIERANSEDNADYDIEQCYLVDSITDESMERLNSCYRAIMAKGTTVYFSFSPLNKNALSSDDVVLRRTDYYSNIMDQKLDRDVKIISRIWNYTMEGRYFYDSDYHLSTLGALERTSRLIRDIKNAQK